MIEDGTSGSDGCEIIAFRCDEQEYGVDIMSVREIRGWTNATALPHSPPYVRGVTNLRGAVLPVVDLNLRLGGGQVEPESRHVVIVVQVEDKLIGLLVDAVSDILTVQLDSLQETPEIASDTARSFVHHVVAIDTRMIRLISLETILGQDAIVH